MKRLRGRNILVILGGGPALGGALELIRYLDRTGARIQVAPTRETYTFITPELVEAVAGRAPLSLTGGRKGDLRRRETRGCRKPTAIGW